MVYLIDKKQRGFSLIELLISVALGSILLAGMVRVFDGFQQSSALDRSITELQEQGRYAVEYLSERIRLRGFQGCLPPSVLDISAIDSVDTTLIYEVLPVATDLSSDTLPATSLVSHDISAADVWTPAITETRFNELASGSLAFTPKSGTDVMMLRFASVANVPLKTNMATADAAIALDPGAINFTQGDYVLVGDCLQADVFQVTNEIDSADIQLEHGLSGNTSINLSQAYDTNAVVRLFNTVSFFVASSGRTNAIGDPIYSLYEMDQLGDISEIIDGVENMQFLYGVTNSAGNVSFMNSSHADFDSRKVVSIRIGLLMRSRNLSKSIQDTSTYSVAGEFIGTGTSITHSSNRYMRQVFQTTIQIRNRG